MPLDSQEFSAIIEEYKTLREECLKVFEQRTIPLVYMSLIIISLVGGAIQFQKDFLCSLVLTGIFPVAVHWIGKRCTVARISTYIRTEIEPKVDGLQWENWIWCQRRGRIDAFEEWIVSSGVICFYVFVGLCCATYYVYAKLSLFSVLMLMYNFLLALVLLYLLRMGRGKRYLSRKEGPQEVE